MAAALKLSRRGFLQSALGAAGALLLPGVSQVQAANQFYRPIRYAPDRGFNQAQLALLGQAVNLVAQRMLDPRMLAYTLPRYRRYLIQAPGRRFNTARDFEGWFHHIQMQTLRVCGFPALYLAGAYHPRENWTGRGQIARVTAEFAAANGGQPRHYTQGTFAVTLNTALFGNPNLSYGRDAAYWAGTICHEMLHNLGHHHPEGVYDGYFIRVYETAVWRNGQ